MPARPQDAASFHALHRDLLILPNAWDAASARVIQDAGAAAVALAPLNSSFSSSEAEMPCPYESPLWRTATLMSSV